MRIRSFRLRIAFLSAGTSGLVLIGLSCSFAAVLGRYGLERIDRELKALADAQVRTHRPPSHWARFDEYLVSLYGAGKGEQFLVRVQDAEANELFRSQRWPHSLEWPRPAGEERATPSLAGDGIAGTCPPACPAGYAPAPLLDLSPPRFATLADQNRTWRFVFLDNGAVRLALGIELADFLGDIRRFRRTVVATAPWILFPLAVFGWVVAEQAMKPVVTLTQAVRGITAKGLDQRVSDAEADRELQALIEVINDMLNRLERSFEQATRFGADAAHELKTPLTILQGELQQALHSVPPDSDGQERIASWIEEVQRLKVIVRKLLLLAYADAGQMRLVPERLDLSEEVEILVEDLRESAEPLAVSAEIAPAVRVEADPDLLRQALQNLVGNAIKYNREGGFVKVTLAVEDRKAVFRIANAIDPGASIDPGRLFERFYRADKARGRNREGAGLGLSLALEIFRAHGGDLRLESLKSDAIAFVAALPLPDPAVAV